MSRYELPNPKCKHARRGLVSAGDPHGAYASTQVCARPSCIEDAIEWAEAQVRQRAIYRADAGRVIQPTLFSLEETPR